MAEVKRGKIIEMIEGLEKPEDSLIFKLSPTFGGHYSILKLNPHYPEKSKKKYTLYFKKNMEDHKVGAPFMESSKAKKLAAWVAERGPELVQEPQPGEKAA